MMRRLLVLNGLAVLAIPVYHSTSFGLQAMFLWTNRYLPVAIPNYDQLGSLSYYALMFARQIASFGVPAFLFVSGFFIAFMGRGLQQVSWAMVFPRIKTLLVPLVIWTIVQFSLLMRLPESVNDVLDKYYYIVLLVQLFLLAPLLVPWARAHWLSLLVVTGLIQLGIEGIEFLNALEPGTPWLKTVSQLNVRWIFAAKIFHFALGLVVGIHLEGAKLWLARVKWVLLGGVVVTLCLTMVEYGFLASWSDRAWLGANNPGLSRILYASLVAPCFLAFSGADIPRAAHLEHLGAKSLGVYLANEPFAFALASMMYHWTPWALGSQLVYQTVLILGGLAGPLLLMGIWKNSPARSSYRQVFG